MRIPVLTVSPLPAREARVQDVLAGLFAGLDHFAPQAERIHRIRVAVKKLRGWIRLVRLARGRRVGVRADQALRAVSRALGPIRDRDNVARTLTLLSEECRKVHERESLKGISPRLRRTDVVVQLPGLSRSGTARLRRLSVLQPGTTALQHGLAQSYRQARRAGIRASKPGAAPELRHRWRKRVKYLYYQSRLVCGSGKTPWQDALEELGSVLGELQDLHVLRQALHALRQPPADAGVRALLKRAVARRVARLPPLYGRCFGEKGLTVSL